VFGKYAKYGWMLFIGANLIIAVLVAEGFSTVENHGPPAPMEAALRTYGPQTSEPFDPNLDTQSPPDTSPSPIPSQTKKPQPKYNLNPRIDSNHTVEWAVLDMKTGLFAGSSNWDKPVYLMSMIKPWIVADYFNQHTQRPTDDTLNQLASMIVDSNDQAAYKYFSGQPSWDRLIRTCGLSELVPRSWSWSLTQMSARDAVRLGYCIYSGMATTPQWTAWIIDKMRHVRGDGDFGPRLLFQDRTIVATKNGWYNWQGKWYVNCLSITDDWAISTLQQWPYEGGTLQYGIGLANPICKSVADQVLRLNVL
jgi:hypothetical protein